MLFAQIPLLNSSASSSATLILNADTFAWGIFIFTQALMQNEATKSGKHKRHLRPWLKKEIEEQVHARREGAKELLQGKTMLEGDSRRDRLDAEPLEASTAP